MSPAVSDHLINNVPHDNGSPRRPSDTDQSEASLDPLTNALDSIKLSANKKEDSKVTSDTDRSKVKHVDKAKSKINCKICKKSLQPSKYYEHIKLEIGAFAKRLLMEASVKRRPYLEKRDSKIWRLINNLLNEDVKTAMKKQLREIVYRIAGKYRPSMRKASKIKKLKYHLDFPANQ